MYSSNSWEVHDLWHRGRLGSIFAGADPILRGEGGGGRAWAHEIRSDTKTVQTSGAATSAATTAVPRDGDRVMSHALHEHEGGNPVLHLEGELDVSVSEELEQQLLRALRHADERLCVDLSEVTYIDSSSVRALLRAAAIAHDRGKRVQVTGVSRISRRVLELSGVEDLLGLDLPM